MSRQTGCHEVRLGSGVMTEVVRVGDTVRRATGPWSPAVNALLRHLEAVGFAGAPRVLGVDSAGRQVLTYLSGEVPDDAHPDVVTDGALADVGRLTRELHAVVADFTLPPGVSWFFTPLGGPGPHVVCHHDLAPRNTVFRDGRAVAFIDWDLATVDAPIHDLSHAAWQFVPLATDDECARQGWAEPPDRGRRLRVLLDAYGLPANDRPGFASRVADRMESSARGIEMLAGRAEAAHRRLVADGIPDRIRRDRAWVLAHAAVLDAAIHSRPRFRRSDGDDRLPAYPQT